MDIITPDMIMAALDAVKTNDTAAAIEILEQLIVAAASGEPADEPADVTPPEGTDVGSDTTALVEGEEDEQMLSRAAVNEDGALAKALTRMTGTTTAGEAVERLNKVMKRLDNFDAEAAALELSERRGLIASLVRIGAEVPALAWEGEPSDRKPCKRLAQEPMPELRRRVELLQKVRPVSHIRTPKTGDNSELTEDQNLALSKLPDAASKQRFTERQALKAQDRRAR